MDRVDSNERCRRRRRRLHGGSAEVITLRGDGPAFFRMISSSSTLCIGCLLRTLDEWPNRRKRKHNGKNQKKTGNMRVVKIISQDATDKLTKDMPGKPASWNWSQSAVRPLSTLQKSFGDANQRRRSSEWPDKTDFFFKIGQTCVSETAFLLCTPCTTHYTTTATATFPPFTLESSPRKTSHSYFPLSSPKIENNPHRVGQTSQLCLCWPFITPVPLHRTHLHTGVRSCWSASTDTAR